MSADTRNLPAEHRTLPPRRVGVLLINLGTPEGTGYFAIRSYLSEFLSDRRVIEMSPLAWQPILQGPILTFRPRKAGKLYRKIWNQERDESPLRTATRSIADALKRRLADCAPELLVDWAMRYGSPRVADRLEALQQLGCDRVLLVAMYPQYSATTTASAYDAAFAKLLRMRWQPAIRSCPAYHDAKVYIDALAESYRTHVASLDFVPELTLASFHGLPKAYFDRGDPYYCHCMKTARLLRERLELEEERFVVGFQSRFGPAEWLQPYSDDLLREAAQRGIKRVVVITPGFATDCLETLEEIAIGSREQFLAAGGEAFSLVPCLNDSELGVDVFEELVRAELRGWVKS